MPAKKASSLDAINYKIDEIIQLAKNVESNARDWAERFKALVEALAEAKKRRSEEAKKRRSEEAKKRRSEEAKKRRSEEAKKEAA
jgi:hypothetical protein